MHHSSATISRQSTSCWAAEAALGGETELARRRDGARSAARRGPLPADRQLLTADRRVAERMLDRIRDLALHVDEREIVEQLDRTDHRSGHPGLVGDGPDEVAGSQA